MWILLDDFIENLPNYVVGFRSPEFPLSSYDLDKYNIFKMPSSIYEQSKTDTDGNSYVYSGKKTYSPWPESQSQSKSKKPEECKLSDVQRKSIREQMKLNPIIGPKNKIKIVFSYCQGDSGIKLVKDYKDKIEGAVNKFRKLKASNSSPDLRTHKVIFETSNPTNFNTINITDTPPLGWEVVKKYNKTDSNITKIKVYLNNEEYKEIPYRGTITDDYHKILFTSSFDIFPTKKLKIKN